MLRKLGFAATLLVCIISCTYAPEEEYFKEVEEPNIVASISLAKYDDQDTIYLYVPTNFDFNVGVNQGGIKTVEVLLDGKVILSTSSTASKFSIDNSYLKTGVFELSIQFTSSTNSGSLADKIGAELVQVWRKWVLVIDIEEPPVPALKFTKENGFLKISWDPFLKPNFTRYGLSVEDYSSQRKRYIEITDPSQSFWIDSAYVGGNTSIYYLYVYTVLKYNTSGEIQHWTSQNISVSYHSSDSTAKLSWRKADCEGAFKEYRITELYNPEPTIINNIQDTTLSLKLTHVLFGRPSGIRFEVYSKSNFYTPFVQNKDIKNTVETKKLLGSVFAYHKELNVIFGLRDTWLRFFDRDLLVSDSLNVVGYSPITPSLGNFVYLVNTKEIVQHNITTKEQKKLQLDTVYKYKNGPTYVTCSSNQLVSYGVMTQPSVFRFYENVYDFSSKKLIYTKGKNYVSLSGFSYTNPILPDDGRFAYFRHTRELYSTSNGTLQLIGTLPGTGGFICFRSDNNSEILTSYSDRIEIYNSEDLSLNRTISIPGGAYECYDPATKNILFTQFGMENQFLVNIETSETRTLKVFVDNSTDYLLLGGYLFNRAKWEYVKVIK